ncbi:hypothetical protein MAUB1S_11388 [Mycolicibacterium aubagnense]
MSAIESELTGDINKLETHRKQIQERLGNLFGQGHTDAHEEIRRINFRLRRLYLTRDKLRRLEIYR